ncbi:MAG TPA: type I methionyl aminopeptidase, partial [Phaeodactylibacter sp.]|nr:type I methionyl aminopeptidase [Phaeodactylibacter sp.]
DHGALPGFKGYNDFPNTLCISVNEAVVHGIPSQRPFQNGDIVSVDCGTFMSGFFGDAAYSFAIGEVPQDVMQLLRVTKTSLYKGIEQVKKGNRVGDIGYAIQYFCESVNPYGVVRELVGHGVGKDLHEAPEVPNFGRRGNGPRLKDGLVIAIEPMVNMGKKEVMQTEDGWTIISKDRKPSAHFEHTVALKKEGVDILSSHKEIEEAIRQNPHLREVDLILEGLTEA